MSDELPSLVKTTGFTLAQSPKHPYFLSVLRPMPEKRRSSLPLTLGAAGLLVGGGVAAYWLLVQRHGWLGDLPVGANIIPQEALFSLSVSTDAKQWQQLRQLGTPQIQAQLDKYLSELGARLETNGYNYQRDIQPWVGEEVTIALLPPQLTLSTNSPPQPPATTARGQQSLVAILPITNPAAAKELLEQPKPLKQGQWIERSYNGLEIRETQGLPTHNYSATILDQRFLVVTDNSKAIERAIDTYKGAASLAQTAGYTKALSQIPTTEHFAQLYVNVPVAAMVAAANPARSFSPQGLAQLQNNQGLAATINLEPQGILIKSISWLKPNSERVHAVKNGAGGMQSRLPSETLMMVSGGSLQRLWQDYAQEVKSNPIAPIQPEGLRAGVKSMTGLDLDQDLLKWMDGEFALSVIPAAPKAGAPDNFALSLVFMVQTKDRSKAEQSLLLLDRVMRNRYQFQAQETKVKDRPVVNWIAPYGTLTASHGWLDDNVAFLSLGASVAERLVPKPQTALANTEQFQKTVPSGLNPNNGQFFLNVEPTIKALPLPQLFSGQKIFFDATRSIGVTSAVSDERSIRYDVFVGLKQVGEGERGR